MTRSPGPERPRAARPPGRKDPYGLLPSGTPLAAILSIVGLVVLGIVTLSLINGSLPFGGGGTGNGNGEPGATDDPKVLRTPTPSDVVRGPHRGARARRSRAPWSMPRPATSGSRQTARRRSSPMTAMTPCRRSPRMGLPCTS